MTSIFSLLAELQKHRHKDVKSPISNTSLWLKGSHESKLLLQICLIVSTDSFETKDKASVIEKAVTDPGFWFSRLSWISSECLHWRWTKTHIRNIRMATGQVKTVEASTSKSLASLFHFLLLVCLPVSWKHLWDLPQPRGPARYGTGRVKQRVSPSGDKGQRQKVLIGQRETESEEAGQDVSTGPRTRH